MGLGTGPLEKALRFEIVLTGHRLDVSKACSPNRIVGRTGFLTLLNLLKIYSGIMLAASSSLLLKSRHMKNLLAVLLVLITFSATAQRNKLNDEHENLFRFGAKGGVNINKIT